MKHTLKIDNVVPSHPKILVCLSLIINLLKNKFRILYTFNEIVKKLFI